MLFDKLPFWQRLSSVIVGVISLLVIWHFLLRFGIVTSLLLPYPSSILNTLIHFCADHAFWKDLGATIVNWLAGIVIGSVLGGVVGLTLGLSRYVWAATEPWVEFFRSMPSVVLVPLVGLFLGVGSVSRIASASIVVFVLMISSAAVAVRSAKTAHLRLAISWRVSKMNIIRTFILPSVLTHMLIALRAVVPIALIVTVAADMLIATDSGIGRIIMDASAVFDTAKLYAAVFVIGLLGYASALITTVIERKFIHWSGV